MSGGLGFSLKGISNKIPGSTNRRESSVVHMLNINYPLGLLNTWLSFDRNVIDCNNVEIMELFCQINSVR